ncbi:SDR family NAD(P)-dependent oxidoreductase [Leptolyngbya sp. FACHB-261]|uniref:SDR family NAD(P)-dependent oxidoreductase n=1 Tax=Leptolyngbya sp. FACHB-261 TaxID=2692806 RepID=UPI0016862249|nr:SDR family oxidoreductase [Leptolyngbya sp. FACHB-261]MBD2102508.1 SDR family oxidoreductase [Leptolyngbya sp. FACHB-261]
MSLNDKVVLITGGGTGIGADAAHAFHAAGAKVVLNGRRQDKLSQTAAKIDPSGESVAYLAGDIGRLETSQNLMELAVERFGGVDILFNNAGVFQPKAFLDHTEQDLNGYLNLLRGYFFTSQAAIPEIRKRGGGAIVNLGSMWALHAIAATPCSGSSAAKGAVHALTRNLAIEFAPENIRVNAIAPAVVETPLFDSLLTPEQLASFNAFHPLGRNGQPKDITEAVLFLADDSRSGWITGIVLPVDGGVTTGRN